MNTERKEVNLSQLEAANSLGTIRAAYPESLTKDRWKEDLASLDTSWAKDRNAKHLFTQHMGGSVNWLVDITGEYGDTLTQKYPHPITEREVLRTKVRIGPGQRLTVLLITMASGATENPAGSVWLPGPSWGHVTIETTWSNDLGGSNTTSRGIDIPGSPEQNGALLTDGSHVFSAKWGQSHKMYSYLNFDPPSQWSWSEWSDVEFTIYHSGGARVIQVSVYEEPHIYQHKHDNTDVSMAVWSESNTPTSRPQTDMVDGGTWEEHRFGTSQSMLGANKSLLRNGPHVATWSSYAETLTGLGEITARSTTSTTFEGLGCAAIAAVGEQWDPDAPGFLIQAPFHLGKNNLHTRTRTASTGSGEQFVSAIPLKFGVYARFTTAGGNRGTVRWSSSPRSNVSITIPQSDTWAWHETTGWLEACSSSRDVYCLLQDHFKTTGGVFEVRYWYVDFLG